MASRIDKIMREYNKAEKILLKNDYINRNDNRERALSIKNVIQSFKRRRKSIVTQILSRTARNELRKCPR